MRGPSSFDDRAPRMVLFIVLNNKVEKLDVLLAIELDTEDTVVDDVRSLVKPVKDARLGDLNEVAVMGQRPVCRPLHDQLHF